MGRQKRRVRGQPPTGPSSRLRSGPARAEPERVLQTSRAGRRGRSSVPCNLYVNVSVCICIYVYTQIYIYVHDRRYRYGFYCSAHLDLP